MVAAQTAAFVLIVQRRVMTTLSLMGLFCAVACKPSFDSVLKDVERNYTATGFLDPDTFQIACPVDDGADRLATCRQKLTEALVAYKERYDREAYSRRMHQDFLPFITHSNVTAEARAAWAQFYSTLAADKARLVIEKRSGERLDGVFRLRLKDLIYRVQNVS